MFRGGELLRRLPVFKKWRYSSVLIQHCETFPPVIRMYICHAQNFSTAKHSSFTVANACKISQPWIIFVRSDFRARAITCDHKTVWPREILRPINDQTVRIAMRCSIPPKIVSPELDPYWVSGSLYNLAIAIAIYLALNH